MALHLAYVSQTQTLLNHLPLTNLNFLLLSPIPSTYLNPQPPTPTSILLLSSKPYPPQGPASSFFSCHSLTHNPPPKIRQHFPFKLNPKKDSV